jgi:hypothetical protein
MAAASDHTGLIEIVGCLLQFLQGEYLCAVVGTLVRRYQLFKQNASVFSEIPFFKPLLNDSIPSPIKNSNNRSKKQNASTTA